ncbi:MAG: lysylphosphatidylglycerol synthase transmembrane domain-containing protein [Planctomycetia bacterium]
MDDASEKAAPASARLRLPAWVSLTLRLAMTAGLMALALRGVEWPKLIELFSRIDWRWWTAGFAVGLTVQVIAAVRWALLARPIGFPFSLGLFIWRFFEGAFFSLCLPTSIGGDVVKAYRLADSTHGRLLAGCTVLADRLAGLAALGVLAGAAVIGKEWSLSTLATIGVGAAMLAVVLACFWLGVGSLDRLLALFPEPHAARQFIARLLPYQMQPSLMTRAVAWSLVVQMGGAITVALVARGLGVTLPLSVWFAVVPLVALAMVLPISIGGVGVREGGLAFLLAPAGVAPERAVAIGLLWFLTTIGGGLIGGLLFLLDRRPNHSLPAGAPQA